MKKINTYSILTVLVLTFAIGGIIKLLINSPAAYAAPATVDLQTAAPFAILAGTPNITDTGNFSVITGNVGLSPATGAAIGLLCSQVTGTIYSVNAFGPPCKVTDNPLLVAAKNDLVTAFDDIAGRTPLTTVPTELGGTTKTAGVYNSSSTTFEITAGSGPLILDGQGDPSSVFIFEMDEDGTGLIVGPGSTVSLANGAQACNVFWKVNTASINTTAVFKGSILALNSITVANGANIEGRLLARNGNVTLINDTITVPTCTTTPADSEGPGGSSSNTVIPKLPNTGVGSEDKNDLWKIFTLAGLAIVTSVLYFVRKKRII